MSQATITKTGQTNTDLISDAEMFAELYCAALAIGDTEERIAGFLAKYEAIIERLGFDPLA